MEKFGDIINVNTPVLICFYSEGIENSLRMDSELREVSAALKDRVKVLVVCYLSLMISPTTKS